jgi:4-hydroxybenzoate polyprenyltransferase
LLFLPDSPLPHRLDTLFTFSRSMHWLLYIPLFGGFYLGGFAVQCLGESTGLIRFSPPDEYPFSFRQRINIFLNWTKDKDNMWWVKYYQKMATLWKADDNLRQERERLIVLKQMCANGFLAIFIAATLITVHHFWLHGWHWLLLSWFVVLLASLFWGYRVHALRQYARENVIMSQIAKDK